MTDATRDPVGEQINLICCTQVICNEIERGVKQKDVALTYALAIKSEAQGADRPDWPTINRAIIARWSQNGLERVKKMAWAALRPRQPAAAPTYGTKP